MFYFTIVIALLVPITTGPIVLSQVPPVGEREIPQEPILPQIVLAPQPTLKPIATTPEMAVELFMAACRKGDFDLAIGYLDNPTREAIRHTALFSEQVLAFDDALEKRFGKVDPDADQPSHFRWLTREETSEAFKKLKFRIISIEKQDPTTVVVTVWQDSKGGSVLERRMFAVRTEGNWKLCFHGYFGMRDGKRIKKTGPDGKEVEVYVEKFDPKEDRELTGFVKIELLQAGTKTLEQLTRQVGEGQFKNRKEAEKSYLAAMNKLQS